MGNFKEFINENKYKLETNKNHIKKLGDKAEKIIALGKKYQVKEIWMQRKDLFISDIEGDHKKLKDELLELFKDDNINAIISSPSMGKMSIIVDMSSPGKMQYN